MAPVVANAGVIGGLGALDAVVVEGVDAGGVAGVVDGVIEGAIEGATGTATNGVGADDDVVGGGRGNVVGMPVVDAGTDAVVAGALTAGARRCSCWPMRSVYGGASPFHAATSATARP
ncbi:MAG: hypothetical protein ACREO3_06105 [Arenimonas sp.]